MALKISNKETEGVAVPDRFVTVICGYPGIGKTTLALSTDNHILFDFDKGAYRAHIAVENWIGVESWEMLTEMTQEDLEPYDTVIIDTFGKCIESLKAFIAVDDPKAMKNGVFKQHGYGVLRKRFTEYLAQMIQWGKNVVVVCHVTEGKNADDVVTIRIDGEGSSKNHIYQIADIMGMITIENGRRVFRINPSDGSFGKNPGGLRDQVIPDIAQSPYFLDDLMEETRKAIRERNETKQVDPKKVKALRAQLMKLETAEAFTERAGKMKDASPSEKRLLIAVAGEKGFGFVKETGSFIDPEPEEGDGNSEVPF